MKPEHFTKEHQQRAAIASAEARRAKSLVRRKAQWELRQELFGGRDAAKIGKQARDMLLLAARLPLTVACPKCKCKTAVAVSDRPDATAVAASKVLLEYLVGRSNAEVVQLVENIDFVIALTDILADHFDKKTTDLIIDQLFDIVDCKDPATENPGCREVE